MQTIIIGPPGTGKTTRLLNILEDELKHVDPNKIAFVSFTRKGAYEARDRAIDIFNFNKHDLPYFRTLHSMAFRQEPCEILSKKHYRELSDLLGLKFSGYSSQEELPGSRDSGDRLLFLYEFARNTCIPLEEVWHGYGENVDWHMLKLVRDTFNKFKKKRILKDFTDLIEEFDTRIPVKVAIIDEAQDLSTLQWHMVKKAFSGADRIYIAGDDDQAIYKWSGADVDRFLSLKGKKEFLKQSYRLPKSIFNFSQEIASRIKNRFDKSFQPRDEVGVVKYHNYLEGVELDSSSWLLLARNRYMLKAYEELCKLQGRVYSTKAGSSVDQDHCEAIYAWENYRKGTNSDIKKARPYITGTDKIPWFNAFTKMNPIKKEYYRAILRRDGNLAKKPNIHIDSIHGVKGGEAENVILMTDMSWKSYQNYMKHGDDEHRVFYVGATRAIKNLHIIMPTTSKGYQI